MKTLWGKLISIICFLCLFAWTVSADQVKKVNDLSSTEESLHYIQEAMQRSGAVPERIQIHYGTAYRTYDSLDDLHLLADKLGNGLDFKQPETPTNHDYIFNRDVEGVHTELRVVATPVGKSWESYVTVRLTADISNQQALENQLNHVYKDLVDAKIFPQFNTCIQGKYNDTLRNDVQLMKINQLFTTMGASVVEKVEDSTVKSYSGYSPRIAPSIFTNGHEMNLQVGLHVDQLNEVTRVTIGTPIITMEY